MKKPVKDPVVHFAKTGNIRAYIMGDVGLGKKRLITECTKKTCKEYKANQHLNPYIYIVLCFQVVKEAIVDKIIVEIVAKGLNKVAAKELRDTLTAK